MYASKWLENSDILEILMLIGRPNRDVSAVFAWLPWKWLDDVWPVFVNDLYLNKIGSKFRLDDYPDGPKVLDKLCLWIHEFSGNGCGTWTELF